MGSIICSLLLLAVFTSGYLSNHEPKLGADPRGFFMVDDQIVIRDGWLQEGPPSQKITAAYLVIENHSNADIALKSASTDAAEVIELHKMELVDGLMKMHRVDTIDIPAGGKTELKPGGFHLMVIGLKRTLKSGDQVRITLQFSNDLSKTITIPVKTRGEIEKEN